MAMVIGDNEKQPSKQTGTGFTNIQNVLNANSSNRLGQNIGGSISNIGQQSQQRLGAANDQFKQDIDPSTQNINAGQNVNKAIQGANFSTGEGVQALSDAGTAANGNLVKTLGAGYQGPQGLGNAAAIQSQANQASQFGRLAGTDQGRQALLQRYAGGDQYSQGQQRLDSALLGQNMGDLNRSRQQVQGLAGKAQQNIQGAQTQAQNVGTQFNALGQAINSGLTSQEAAYTTQQQKQLSDARAQALAQTQGIQSRLQATQPSLTNQDISQLQSVFQGGNIYNLSGSDIANMIKANQGITAGQVASTQDVASRQALAQLSGQDANSIYAMDPTQAGQGYQMFNPSDVAGSVLGQKKDAADAAMAAFNPASLSTHPEGFNDLYNYNTVNTTPLDYNKTKQIINPQIVKDVQDPYNMQNNIDLNKQLGLLQQQGLINRGWNLASDGGSQVANMFTNELAKNYNNLNTQYGIGRTLQDLLAQDQYKGK